MDVIGVIDNLGALLFEVYKFCADKIFNVSWSRRTFSKRTEYFVLGTQEKSEWMEKFLKENNFLFLMANDVPFTD